MIEAAAWVRKVISAAGSPHSDRTSHILRPVSRSFSTSTGTMRIFSSCARTVSQTIEKLIFNSLFQS